MPDNSTGSHKPVDFQFNAKSRDAQRWSKRYAGERITNLNTETKLAVRKIVTDSIRDGVPPRDAAKQIREMVGLNRPQGIALRRYVGGLSPSLTTAAKAKAGIKLKNKMIRRRAITIARTEVIDSLSAGVEKSWQQAQGKGLLGKNAKKEWITTPVGACAVCRALNGQIVPLSKNFESGLGPLARPTAHPNCRCGIAPVPGVGGPLTAAATPPTATPRMPLTADGLIIRGADARQAILKYADDPKSAHNVKLAKLKREAKALTIQLEELEEARRPIRAERMRLLRIRVDLDAPEGTPVFSSPLPSRSLVNKELGEVNKKYGAVIREVDAVFDKLNPVNAEIFRLSGGITDDILEGFIYNKTRNTNLTFEISEKSRVTPRSKRFRKTMKNQKEREAFNEGAEAWRRMTDDELFAATIEGEELSLTANLDPATVKVFRERERAYAQSWGERDYQVHLVLDDASRGGKATTVHELTHTTEYGNPDVLAEAINWRDIKTHGDELKKLRELTGDKGYKTWEVAYEDDFITRANPDGKGSVYIGKRYNTDVVDTYKVNKVYTERSGWQGSTEVSTMGMELMYRDPVKFARELPELFDFVFERIIRRKYTHGTSRWSLRGDNRFTFEMKSGPVRRYKLEPQKN